MFYEPQRGTRPALYRGRMELSPTHSLHNHIHHFALRGHKKVTFFPNTLLRPKRWLSWKRFVTDGRTRRLNTTTSRLGNNRLSSSAVSAVCRSPPHTRGRVGQQAICPARAAGDTPVTGRTAAIIIGRLRPFSRPTTAAVGAPRQGESATTAAANSSVGASQAGVFN